MNIALNHFPESERAALKKFLDGVKARTGYTVRTSGSGDREVHEFVAPRAPGPNVVRLFPNPNHEPFPPQAA